MSTGGYDPIVQKRETIVTALRNIAVLIGEPQHTPVSLKTGGSVVPGIGANTEAKSINTRAQDIEQGLFKVIVLGDFKNGKSTLLNAMLGNEMLPAKTLKCTAIITLLVYGNSQKVAVYETNKPGPRMLSLEDFKQEFQLIAEDEETLEKQKFVDRFKDIEYAQMECQHPFCANGVKLIDSPGLGDHPSRTRMTTNFLQQAHAIIVVLVATKLLNEEERDFIKTNFTPGQKTVFFVVNRINEVRSERDLNDVKAYLQRFLTPIFRNRNGQFDEEFYMRRVFFVDALGAQEARLSAPANSAQLEASGTLPFERELERFLTSDERVAAALASTMQTLEASIVNARKTIVQRRAAMEQPLEVLEQRRKEAEVGLQVLEGKKADFEKTIMHTADLVNLKLSSSLRDYISEMQVQWRQEAETYLRLENVGFTQMVGQFILPTVRERVAQEIQGELNTYLEKKLEQWAGQNATLVQQDLEQMQAELENQAQDFQLELERIANVFGNVEAGLGAEEDPNKGKKWFQLLISALMLDPLAVTGTILGSGDWSRFVLRMVGLLLYGIFLGFLSGGLVWIIAIVIAVGRVAYQGEHMKEQIRIRIGEALFETLEQKRPEMRAQLEQNISQDFSRFAQRATASLQDQINQVRAQQEQIIQQKQSETFSAEQEKERLGVIESELTVLVNTIKEAASGSSSAAVAV